MLLTLLVAAVFLPVLLLIATPLTSLKFLACACSSPAPVPA